MVVDALGVHVPSLHTIAKHYKVSKFSVCLFFCTKHKYFNKKCIVCQFKQYKKIDIFLPCIGFNYLIGLRKSIVFIDLPYSC